MGTATAKNNDNSSSNNQYKYKHIQWHSSIEMTEYAYVYVWRKQLQFVLLQYKKGRPTEMECAERNENEQLSSILVSIETVTRLSTACHSNSVFPILSVFFPRMAFKLVAKWDGIVRHCVIPPPIGYPKFSKW